MSVKNYESLPDLLEDLKKMIRGVSIDESSDKPNWRADIKCGGNYHKITFSTTAQYKRYLACPDYDPLYFQPVGTVTLSDTGSSSEDGESSVEKGKSFSAEGFPDFDSLHAELAHMREFILANELNNNDQKVDLQYAIKANSNQPHLSVTICGYHNQLNDCSSEAVYRVYDNIADNNNSGTSGSGFMGKLYKFVDPGLIKAVVNIAIVTPIIVIPTAYIIKKMNT
jgi:hypothetical protein